MKHNILTLITFVTAILFSSCEKEIEFKGEQTDSKLVINSLVEVGQPVKARISKSCFFLDNERDYSIPQGTVAQLFVNDNFYGNMDIVMDSIEVTFYTYNGDSIGYNIEKHFQSDYCPVAGDVIKIMASAPGFDDVEGTTSPMPEPMTCRFVGMTIKDCGSYYDSYYYYQDYTEEDSVLILYGNVELTVEITDPNPGQTNYFKISTQRQQFDEGTNNQYYLQFQYDDPIFGGSLLSSDYDYIEIDLETRPDGVFTDVFFDGKSYQIKIPAYFDLRKTNDADPNFFQVPIRIEHFTKEYYNYLNTCEQGDEFTQFWAEPIQTFSNVEGGYGLVGGRYTDTVRFMLPLEE